MVPCYTALTNQYAWYYNDYVDLENAVSWISLLKMVHLGTGKLSEVGLEWVVSNKAICSFTVHPFSQYTIREAGKHTDLGDPVFLSCECLMWPWSKSCLALSFPLINWQGWAMHIQSLSVLDSVASDCLFRIWPAWMGRGYHPYAGKKNEPNSPPRWAPLFTSEEHTIQQLCSKCPSSHFCHSSGRKSLSGVQPWCESS